MIQIPIAIGLMVACLLTGCASPRVIVKDCQYVSKGFLDCEKVHDLE